MLFVKNALNINCILKYLKSSFQYSRYQTALTQLLCKHTAYNYSPDIFLKCSQRLKTATLKRHKYLQKHGILVTSNFTRGRALTVNNYDHYHVVYSNEVSSVSRRFGGSIMMDHLTQNRGRLCQLDPLQDNKYVSF